MKKTTKFDIGYCVVMVDGSVSTVGTVVHVHQCDICVDSPLYVVRFPGVEKEQVLLDSEIRDADIGDY